MRWVLIGIIIGGLLLAGLLTSRLETDASGTPRFKGWLGRLAAIILALWVVIVILAWLVSGAGSPDDDFYSLFG